MANRVRSAIRKVNRKYLDIPNVTSFVPAITVQGSHTSPSTLTLQATDPEGHALSGFFMLRMRVMNVFGGVQTTTVGTAGTGYTSVPTVTFAAPTLAGGVTATGVAVLSTTTVGSITITNPGSGYTAAPAITITGGGGINAAATCTVNTTIANATNATIAAGTGTQLVDTLSATKDLVFMSNAAGLFTITCTDATVETFQIRLTDHFTESTPYDTSLVVNITHA